MHAPHLGGGKKESNARRRLLVLPMPSPAPATTSALLKQPDGAPSPALRGGAHQPVDPLFGVQVPEVHG